MASLSLNLDERTLKNGMGHIRLRISHRGTNVTIGTQIYCEPQYFQPGMLYEPINRRAYMAVDKREKVAAIVRQYEEFIVNSDKELLDMLTAADIRDYVQGSKTNDVGPKNYSVVNSTYDGQKLIRTDFLTFFDEYGKTRISEKSKKSYVYVWNMLNEYCKENKMSTIYFDQITYQTLTKLCIWIRNTGRGESTRHMVEAYIRAAYREAERMHVISRDADPFYDYSIRPVPEQEIETLTVDQLRNLISYDLKKYPAISRARDIAVMSFYLCGANLMDMFLMDKPKNGDVVFVRHKISSVSQRPVHIRIEPELETLLSNYAGKQRMFDFVEHSPNYETFQRRVNLNLSRLSNFIGYDVTLAKIRRTWASVAGHLDISDRVIDKSMGHKDSSVKNKNYEDYDWTRTARANRRIIDYILTDAIN